MSTPTILIPGVQGTTLVNTNTLDFDTIWSGVQSKFESIFDLALQKDARFDASPGAIIERSDVEDLAYQEAVFIIKNKIQSPVYIFGYDWRLSCAENARRLQGYVDNLKEKIGVQRFNFVTHSMGGMIFSCYLRMLNNVYDVIQHAILTVCPFEGSIHALIALIVGEGGIRFPLLNSNDEFRKIARTFPSVYELCPSYPGAIVFDAGHPLSGTPFDLYDPDHWQENIKADALFADRLGKLRAFRDAANPAMLGLGQLPADVKTNFLIIVGEGEDTKNKVVVKPHDQTGTVRNFFEFEQPDGDGDGTVPLESSTIYKGDILTLSVKSKWYDKATHAFFLNDGRVQTLIKRFLGDEDVQYPQWWSTIGGSVRKI